MTAAYQKFGAQMGKSKTDLLSGTLDLIVLRLLQGGSASGWEISKSIRVLSRDALDINYGSLYPALHRLEGRGLIKAKWGLSELNHRARYYSLTVAGRTQLRAEKQSWKRFADALGMILRGA